MLPTQKGNADTGADIESIASYEDLMYAQPDLVDASLKRLRPQTPGKIDLYALGFAGDGEQNVFRNEVDYLPKLLAQRFGAAGRTLQLINSPQTFEKTPLATRTNLYDALSGIASTMDVNEDILLLFLTSHGSQDHQLFVEMGELPLDQITPQDVRDALDAAHIRWRIVVISACYSGGFIPALRDSHTMIITAARSDRTSFGCGSDSQITWFGKAFLTEALNQTTDFRNAYLRARTTIAGWEKRDGETPSEPQYWAGTEIQQKLDAWRATLPSAAAVPFVPISIASREHRRAR
ncbi:MAG TPA: C13 family peptidase [Xanthomonadaceae bacterium]|nr:C13 family peptidase [Xanthomonadaceae bacterium]